MKKTRRLEDATLNVTEIRANPRNPRVHPQDQLENLAASLRRFGQTKRVLLRADNKMLIAGEGIWRAAQLAGITEIDAVLWHVDQKIADAYMLADNQHGKSAADDTDRIAVLLREIEAAEWPSVGFSEGEARKLLESMNDDLLEVVSIETSPVADEFWLSVRGPLKDQAAVLQEMRKLLARYPQVNVELGTVASS